MSGFFQDLVGRALSAHPSAQPAPAPRPPLPPPAPAAVPMAVGRAVSGLVGLEKIAFAARQAIAMKGGSLPADKDLTLALLDEAALLIPQAAALDDAAHVAAIVIPLLIALRREHPMNNPVVDAQTAHATPYWGR